MFPFPEGCPVPRPPQRFLIVCWWCPPDCTSSNAHGLRCLPKPPVQRVPVHPCTPPSPAQRRATHLHAAPRHQQNPGWVPEAGRGVSGGLRRAAPGPGGAAGKAPAEAGPEFSPGAPRAPLKPAPCRERVRSLWGAGRTGRRGWVGLTADCGLSSGPAPPCGSETDPCPLSGCLSERCPLQTPLVCL